MRLAKYVTIPGVLFLTAACASSGPSKELTEARSAYNEAAQAGYNHTVPDHMYEARQRLQMAERAHEDDAESLTARHQAYLAKRQAEFAMEQGHLYQAKQDLMSAKQAYDQAQAELQAKTEDELQRAEQRSGALQDATVRLTERQRELQQQLAEAKTERERAELRAAAAIASLERIAQIKEEANEWTITLSGAVLFETGKSELLPIAKSKLDQVAEALKQQDERAEIVVEGHTDSRGTDAFNQQLSKERATSVREYLVSQGVDAERIKAVGKGESEPLAANDTPEGRANNRRVEIRVTNGDSDQSATSGRKATNSE